MEQSFDDLSLCPSFTSYSSDRFAEIAARVSEEFSQDSEFGEDEEQPVETSHDFSDNDDGDDDFEFALVAGDPDALADEIFYGGQIRGVFPIFNRHLIENDTEDHQIKPLDEVSRIRIPLKNLFVREREDELEPPSSSSSEADELESVPPGTFCVWRPKVVESSPSRCKKSNSTGSSSKGWKIRDLIRRSNSDGKDSFVFLTPKNTEEKPGKSKKIENPKEKKTPGEIVKVTGKSKAAASAHEAFYVRNRALKEGNKRKSYLPYRPDLVGFFVNGNGLGRTFPAY
ncbi:unnamed protein product [Ilex paraguariensis]|uniref:Uncharacterized protein n=1 Tax=Ilex paraguariensis TaxID=185542 RepID=A0ABC8T0I3_9AQUA